MANFESDQQAYYTNEINRALPTKSSLSNDALHRALSDVDPIMPGDNRRQQEASSFLSKFETTNNLPLRDAECRAYAFPNQGMRDPEARTGCGWWYTTDSNRPSVGAYGSRNGPMNSMMDVQYGRGEWIWNIADAQRKESQRATARVTDCRDLEYIKEQTPNIGWCTTMNSAIMTDGNGNPAYPNSPGGYCPPGERIVMTSAECPVPSPALSSAGQGGGSSGSSTSDLQSTSSVCVPNANGALSPACLKKLTLRNCSSAGSLAAAYANGYPNTSQDFVEINAYLTERNFTLNSGLLNDGRLSTQEALRSIAALSQFANSGENNNSTAAALNMCYGSPFNPCNISASQPPPHDIKCIKKTALEMGYSPAGRLLQTTSNDWRLFPTWGDVVAKLTWWKDLADKGPAFFGGPSDQKTAIENVYGVEVLFPTSPDCSPSIFRGLQVWYDAADPKGNGSIPANGTPIAKWVNKARITKYDAIATSTNKATFVAANRSLNFGGAVVYNTNYPATPPSETIFIVFSNPNPDITRRYLISSQYGGRSFDAGGTGAGPLSVGLCSPGTQWGAATPNGSYTAGTTAMATGIINNGSSQVSINGGPLYSGGANYTPGTTTVLGSYPPSKESQSFKGNAMEIVIFDTILPTTQIQQIQGYLAWKWGIQNNLSSSHPFKNVAP